jgi:hypothetical protein
MDRIERLWPLGWIAGPTALLALGHPQLVLPIYLPALVLLAILARFDSAN